MIESCGVVLQAFLGTLFTWGLTAAGASVVVFIRGSQKKLLDASLGFAAGVMTAASFWSLLDPAIEMAESSKIYGENGQYAFLPVGVGFLFGALFVYGADVFITALGITSPNTMLGRSSSIAMRTEEIVQARTYEDVTPLQEEKDGQWKRIMLLVIAITIHNIPEGLAVGVGFGAIGSSASATFQSARNMFPPNLVQACTQATQTSLTYVEGAETLNDYSITEEFTSTTNIIGLVVVSAVVGVVLASLKEEGRPIKELFDCLFTMSMKITRWVIWFSPIGVLFLVTSKILDVDDISELASQLGLYMVTVFVGIFLQGFVVIPTLYFVCTRKNPYRFLVNIAQAIATAFGTSSRNLAIGIGIQNFPEGLAVSLPLHAAGYSTWRSLWYGQLSGMVEPLFGVLGALTVSMVQPVLPYALAFAAGAMIYVVVDDIIPEAVSHGNGKLASWSTIIGFLVMMTLDVGLG